MSETSGDLVHDGDVHIVWTPTGLQVTHHVLIDGRPATLTSQPCVTDFKCRIDVEADFSQVIVVQCPNIPA